MYAENICRKILALGPDVFFENHNKNHRSTLGMLNVGIDHEIHCASIIHPLPWVPISFWSIECGNLMRSKLHLTAALASAHPELNRSSAEICLRVKGSKMSTQETDCWAPCFGCCCWSDTHQGHCGGDRRRECRQNGEPRNQSGLWTEMRP